MVDTAIYCQACGATTARSPCDICGAEALVAGRYMVDTMTRESSTHRSYQGLDLETGEQLTVEVAPAPAWSRARKWLVRHQLRARLGSRGQVVQLDLVTRDDEPHWLVVIAGTRGAPADVFDDPLVPPESATGRSIGVVVWCAIGAAVGLWALSFLGNRIHLFISDSEELDHVIYVKPPTPKPPTPKSVAAAAPTPAPAPVVSDVLQGAPSPIHATDLRSDLPAFGAPDAPVQIVVFHGFLNAFSRGQLRDLRDFEAENGGIRVYVRSAPATSFRHGLLAEEAARCAHEQGLFWAFYDHAIDKSTAVVMRGSAEISSWAPTIGLDQALLDDCLASGAQRDAVMADVSAAKAVGVDGPPGIVINDKVWGERVYRHALARLLQAELAANGLER